LVGWNNLDKRRFRPILYVVMGTTNKILNWRKNELP
jgi:hypothetical protein